MELAFGQFHRNPRIRLMDIFYNSTEIVELGWRKQQRLPVVSNCVGMRKRRQRLSYICIWKKYTNIFDTNTTEMQIKTFPKPFEPYLDQSNCVWWGGDKDCRCFVVRWFRRRSVARGGRRDPEHYLLLLEAENFDRNWDHFAMWANFDPRGKYTKWTVLSWLTQNPFCRNLHAFVWKKIFLADILLFKFIVTVCQHVIQPPLWPTLEQTF